MLFQPDELSPPKSPSIVTQTLLTGVQAPFLGCAGCNPTLLQANYLFYLFTFAQNMISWPLA